MKRLSLDDISKLGTNVNAMNISVAGIGYVGLSIATLLAQNNEVVAVDIVPDRVKLVNDRKSPIQDDYIEEFLSTKFLHLQATMDWKTGYKIL